MKFSGTILLFLLGATLGSCFDAIHVHSGVERYPVPVLFGLAWWVPLLFGAAAVAIGASHAWIDFLLGNIQRRYGLLMDLSGLAWLLLAYLVSASELTAATKTGLLLIIYLNFWFLVGRSWQNLLLSIVTAITGTLVEMILVTAGAFSYLHPDFIGVPYWLPCMYACASLALGNLGRSLSIATVRGNA